MVSEPKRLLVYNIRYAAGVGPGFHLPVPGAGYLRSNRKNIVRLDQARGLFSNGEKQRIKVSSCVEIRFIQRNNDRTTLREQRAQGAKLGIRHVSINNIDDQI